LLVTHSADLFTIDRVLASLEARGVAAVRVDTDLFPQQLSVSFELRKNKHHSTLTVGQQVIALEQVPAVWCRRFWPGAAADEAQTDLSALFSAQALRQTLTVGAANARWMNGLDAQDRAESKLWQLSLAPGCGLAVAPTLLTNDPSRAGAFATAPSVIKALAQPVASMQPDPAFVYTQPFTAERAAPLRVFPQLIQHQVPRRSEVRLIAVGAKLFAAELERRGDDAVDWRPSKADEVRSWRAVKIPAAVQTGCRAMLRAMGLVFGAFDFIVTPEGRWVFLEVNPAGEWGWLERDAGLPISDAIADWLARP
jgi:glutathione synthase/RimK-type ligase-like ATP-grasp enzyme